MTLVRAQARFLGKSGDPRDVFINTFHFQSVSAFTDTDATELMSRLAVFYSGTTAPLTNSIVAYYSDFLESTVEVRFYDLADLPPRVPKIQTATLGGFSLLPNPNMIEEAAVCLSYSGDTPVTPSRRGRIYLGPLNGAAFAAPANQRTVVVSTFGQVIGAAAVKLADPIETWTWGVWSPTLGTFTPITKGYIDNAPDTQRRRGPTTTGRFLWAAAP